MIALASIAVHWLLPALFERVVAPPAVWSELRAGIERPNRRDLLASDWLLIGAPQTLERLAPMPPQLGAGEAEAIGLAAERSATLVLLDDHRARTTAHSLGLACTGTVGILVRAKQRELLPAVRPLLIDLLKTNFRVSRTVIAGALRETGEL